MSRWIDADVFKTWVDEYLSAFKKYEKHEVKDFVEHQPSIDICPCRECKRANYELSGVYCGLSDVNMGEDGFCSIGERKESE